MTTSKTGSGLLAGEPLLVRDNVGEDTAVVARSDGKRFEVPLMDLVDLALPTKLSAYEKPTPRDRHH